MHDGDHVARQPLRHPGDLQAHDLELLGPLGEVDEEMEAAPLERVGHLAGVVAGEDDERHVTGPQRAELGHAHLEVGEHLEEERLELGVGLVDLVDQEHAGLLRADRLQQRPRQDEAVAEEDVVFTRDAVDGLAERGRVPHHLADLVFQYLRVEELLGVFPLVECLRLVEALVALEPDELVADGGGQHLGELRLPHPRRALDQDRLLHLRCEVDDGRDVAVGDVLLRRETLDDVVDRAEHAGGFSLRGRDFRGR